MKALKNQSPEELLETATRQGEEISQLKAENSKQAGEIKTLIADANGKDAELTKKDNEISVLKQDVDDREAKIKDLKSDLADSEKENDQLSEKVSEQAGTITTLNSIIGSAGQSTSNAGISSKAVIPADHVEHEGKKYKWQRSAFKLAGDTKRYSAEEASNDPAVIKRILEIDGQELLKPVF